MTASSRKTTPQPMPDREILNIDGAAALLGVSIKTFSKVLRQGDVPGRKVGREWKFSRQALIDWVGKSKSRHFMESESGVVPTSERPARSGGSSRRQGDGFSVDNM